MSTSTNSRHSRESATAVVGSPQSRRPRTKPVNWRRAGAWVLVVIAVVVTMHRSSGCSGRHCPATIRWPRTPATFFRPTSAGARSSESSASRASEQAIAEGGSGADINFWLYLRNSIVFATMTTAGQVFFSAMAAYAFSRLRWPGRNKVFAIFLATMMVPPIFTALPNFLMIKNLGLLNTFAGLALPFMFMTPFAIFFLRQFFLSMSREVEEAAMLDGAKHLRIFFQIVIPNAAAPLATLALLTFIGQWNEYFWPLLVGQDEIVRVLTVGLGVFKSQSPQGAPDWSGLMAATLVAALPVLILFIAFGKKVVNSIGFSGIK